jgi:ankyrin repeat protein
VEILLKRGANPFSTDHEGNNALTLAIESDCSSMVKILFDFFDQNAVSLDQIPPIVSKYVLRRK